MASSQFDETSSGDRSSTPPINLLKIQNMTRELEMLRHAYSSFKDDTLISELDPSKQNQGVLDWLNKINDCVALYGWDGVTTTYFVVGKLRGLARVWYDDPKQTRYSWSEWQNMLRKMFPTKEKFSKILLEAATYETSLGQDLNEYCFNKLTKLKLNLSDELIVDCVIAGVTDQQTQLLLRTANFKSFVDLTEFLTNFPPVTHPKQIHFSKRPISANESRPSLSYKKYKDSREFPSATCYICGQCSPMCCSVWSTQRLDDMAQLYDQSKYEEHLFCSSKM